MSTTVHDFTVTVQPSARNFTTHTNESILDAAIRQGVTLPYGCKDGACGSCKCKLLQGQVEQQPHAEQALTVQEKDAGFILTCRAKAQSDITLESRQVTHELAFPIRKMPVRVSSLEKLSTDVMRIIFQLPAQQNFQYHAGQFIEFILKDGSRRAYSMARASGVTNSDEAPSLELHIRHLPGGKFTDHVFGAMQPREILRIEGPFGSFFLREQSQAPIILLATGTGFAPIKAILEDMHHKKIQRPTTLYWGGRTRHDLYMHDWVQSMVQKMPHLQYIPVLSNMANNPNWNGQTGYIHAAMKNDFPNLSQYEVYACGSPSMIEAAKQTAITECHLPQDKFFADAFINEADKATFSLAP